MPMGLIVILPYTQFNSGRWEVQCASVDPLSDLTGANWKYGVHLHVLLRESEGDDWELDWSPPVMAPSRVRAMPQTAPTTAPTETAEIQPAPSDPPDHSAPDSSTPDSSTPDNRVIDAFLEDLTQPDAPVTPELGDVAIGMITPPSTDPSLTHPGLAAPLIWSVQLDRDSFIASRDEVITISGYLIGSAADSLACGTCIALRLPPKLISA